jgi:hypothetical protein
MASTVHPSTGELAAALADPEQSVWALDHLDDCVACRVRMSRIRQAAGLPPASDDALQRIMEASTPLPEILAGMDSVNEAAEVAPDEVWRVGRHEALLVWVRQVFDDRVADVVPLVLDVELADQESVLIARDATPLGMPLAALVALRTHVHPEAFLSRIAPLDISKEVAEVMTAVSEGRRPSGVTVGPPIVDDSDQRLEYRQALRDLLAELSPSAWLESHDDHGSDQPSDPAAGRVESIAAELREYLWGVQCRPLDGMTLPVDDRARATTFLKVIYLDTAVLLATLDGDGLADFPPVEHIAAACQKMTLVETDADAVAVALPARNWEAMLFTTANMRIAVEVPGGAHRGPTPTLRGFRLVETVCKHLEGALTAWEIVEQSTAHIGPADLHQVAARHASASRLKIIAEGKRAHQPAKRAALQDLPEELDDKAARFVVAIVNHEALNDALAQLGVETEDV